jgi:3-methylcrotonyl-CoA carboxylase alpha subunit
MLTGFDLVQAQLRLASGEPLQDSVRQDAIRACGHAIEARVYAERPAMGFLPSPGTITAMDLPAPEPGLRIDTGYRAGDQVTIHYDPMLAKVIAGGADRDDAIDRLDRALEATRIEGIGTNIAFLRKLLAHPRFRAGEVSTGFVDEHIAELRA